eukprot:gnl/Hemi2/23317_TR7825_c0_g2_i1.p1 gnl/Hemi2/23317_TR7825_c0_g2~~gnl/Hemi2/23317_TR7825_c0_g2_i1.p1  ORF type:complete len:325 (+),score=80.42 gnl/Hemi2/23317_TR7825_c0_g2_i1:45-977(+)
MSQARYMSVYNEGVALDTENCLCKYECAVQVGSAKERKIRGKPGPAGEPAKLSTTEHILNSILPPREYQVVDEEPDSDEDEDDRSHSLKSGRGDTKDSKKKRMQRLTKWIQFVSPVVATRLDVLKLMERLDQRVQKVWFEGKARDSGICPIREELYSQTFDELVRQITLQCCERGQLLHRVRQESRTTINAYRSLYESSIAFGMRKALQAEKNKQEMEARVQQLGVTFATNKARVDEMIQRCEETQSSLVGLREAAKLRVQEELAQLKSENAKYRQQLMTLQRESLPLFSTPPPSSHHGHNATDSPAATV